MTRDTIPNGWYGAALVTGEYAVLVPPLKAIQTWVGMLPYPTLSDGTPDEPLFLTITTAGGFKLAGKGHGSLNTWVLEGWGWGTRPDACGNFSVIYDLAGALHISHCEPWIGVQGWRCAVADGTPTGRLLTGDETYGPYRGLTEWSPITDDLTIGQGWDGGGVQLWDRGTMRVLETGACYAIKRDVVGEHVAIYFYRDEGGGRKTGMLVWATVAELRALPPFVAAPVEPPIEPPVIPPVEPPVVVPPHPPDPGPEPEPTPPHPQEPRMIAYGQPMKDFAPGTEHANGDGTVSIQKPNGQWLNVSPEGVVNEAPAPGGLWESFLKGPNGYIASRDLNGQPVVYVLPYVAA